MRVHQHRTMVTATTSNTNTTSTSNTSSTFINSTITELQFIYYSKTAKTALLYTVHSNREGKINRSTSTLPLPQLYLALLPPRMFLITCICMSCNRCMSPGPPTAIPTPPPGIPSCTGTSPFIPTPAPPVMCWWGMLCPTKRAGDPLV